MHFKNLTTKQKQYGIVTLGILALIIFFSAITLIGRIGKVATTVQFAPYAAKVSLNGKKIKNNSTVYLLPGEYNLHVEFDHFETYENTISISKESPYLVGELDASDEQGFDYMKRYNKQFLRTEALASKIANEEGERRNAKYPLLKYLPINNNFYSIAYSYGTDGEPIVNIKSDYEYQDIAVGRLKALEDITIEDYKLSFSSKNPYLYPEDDFSTDPVDFVLGSYRKKPKFHISDATIIDNYAILQVHYFNTDQGYAYGHYRIILRKTEKSWEFAALPQPLYTQDSAPEVPVEVIRAANEL